MSNLVKCTDCGAEVSRAAKACPKCGAPPPAPKISVGRIVIGVGVALIGLPIMFGVLAFLFSRGTSKAVAVGMQDIENQVARDSVAQYEIAKRDSNPIQTCVQAGMVVAAFLQAKDEPNVRKWQAIEKVDCARAGMPGVDEGTIDLAPRRGVRATLCTTHGAPPEIRRTCYEQAETGARVLRTAIQQWQAVHNEVSCPSVGQLVEGGHIQAEDTNDPWGRPYFLNCTADDVRVASSGTDLKVGTSDDLAVPR